MNYCSVLSYMRRFLLQTSRINLNLPPIEISVHLRGREAEKLKTTKRMTLVGNIFIRSHEHCVNVISLQLKIIINLCTNHALRAKYWRGYYILHPLHSKLWRGCIPSIPPAVDAYGDGKE